MKTIAAFAAAAFAAAALVIGTSGSPPAAAQDGGKPVLTIGLQQGIDNMNPIRGYTVAAYEAWNMQYATLTDKKAEDFSIAPGLAESWEGEGQEYTYTLRPDLKWSDGQPLTAEDVAWTINTSREEEWLNHFATTGKLTAEALSDTEVKVTSEVPDPKLPILDVYILPKHVYGEFDKKGRTKFDGQTAVGSGPFTLDEYKKGQFARFKSNPNFWQGQPALDEVIIRKYNNADAMVAALRSGEVDFVQSPPETQFLSLQEDDDFVTVQGAQGGFDELAINGGDGLKKPHPALEDIEVRKAIMHAVDKQTIVDRVLRGIGEPAQAMSVSADPKWLPEIPADEQFDFDLDKANQILDDAGYEDTDGDGVREMPGGGEPLNFRYAVRSESEVSAADRRVHHGLAEGDRHRHHPEDLRRRAARRGHRPRRLRHVRLGLDPVRGPGHAARLLHLRPDRVGPRGPAQLLQRRELLRPGVRQALPAAEGRARPGEARSRSSTRCSGASTRRPSTCRSTTSRTSRPTGRTASRAGSGSRPRPARCCSPTPRRATRR